MSVDLKVGNSLLPLKATLEKVEGKAAVCVSSPNVPMIIGTANSVDSAIKNWRKQFLIWLRDTEISNG